MHADAGSVSVDGEDVARLSRNALFALREKIGFLFQNSALLTDFNVFENVAFPLRQHTKLPEALIRTIVLTKLQAVGLRGAAQLMPSELSGGMARRVALARAIVFDPMLILYDEPFVGLDPIALNQVLRLIRTLNKTLGITSSFGFFQNRLRLLGALDYKGGYVSHNINGLFQCAFIQNCRELNDPNASLFDQARAVAGPRAFGGFAEDASFVRLRELSLTYELPSSWVKWLRGRSAAVTLTGRNLALWTDFTSWDPELSTPAGLTGDASPYNFVQEGQPRSFIIRINLGF